MYYEFATTNITNNIGQTDDALSETHVLIMSKWICENIVEILLRFIYNDMFHWHPSISAIK